MSEDENELKSDLPEENEPDNEKGKIPFTKDSWILGSKYKTRYKRIALTFWTAVVGAVIYFGLRSNLQNIVESYLELGLLKTIPIFWSETAQWLLGLEVLGFMVAGGVLMSMSWWRKEPEAPPTPTVITWLIFILGTIALIIGEALGAVGTAGWTLFFWILFSILGFIYFVLWLFQPWFEYWRHLYCRWVFLWELDCEKWVEKWRRECKEWEERESKECKEWYDKRTKVCTQTKTTREQRCNSWRSTTTKSCASWHWTLSWICLAYSYVTTWFCDAWTWITHTFCVAWAWIVERLCTLWVTIRTFFCKLWGWIVSIVCAIWFFILKLIMLCWWA